LQSNITLIAQNAPCPIDFVPADSYSPSVMVNPKVAPYLPDNIWAALLEINEHITTLPIEELEKRILRDGIEILAVKLAEASKRHHIRYPIRG
jgi:hypothetical protein